MKHVSSINYKKPTSPIIETKKNLQLSNHISYIYQTAKEFLMDWLIITLPLSSNNNSPEAIGSEAFMPFCISTGL